MRQRFERWRVSWTFKVAINREGPRLKLSHSRQRLSHRPRVFNLRLPLLSRHTLSLPSLGLHSLSLPIWRYHLLRHFPLLTMLHGWTYLLGLALLALVSRNLLWLVIHVSIPWRIVWINIKLASLRSLSISSRRLIVLKIARSVNMRR